MREAWMLWRLVRRLKRNRPETRGASINIVVEGGRSWEEKNEMRAKVGLDPLTDAQRRVACEVNVWDDVSVPSKASRGHTLAEALRGALKG